LLQGKEISFWKQKAKMETDLVAQVDALKKENEALSVRIEEYSKLKKTSSSSSLFGGKLKSPFGSLSKDKGKVVLSQVKLEIPIFTFNRSKLRVLATKK
jgi:hypothetical protein